MPMRCVLRVLLLTCFFVMLLAEEVPGDVHRVFLKLNKVSRGGCPYTASFLCTAKHFVNHMKYGLKWQKMEAANWNAISSHRNKYQLHNISAYFVNHMSAYEHSIRKKYGYAKSESKTMEFSSDAVFHECSNIEHVRTFDNRTMALVPFYGGRPPNVTADLKVKSIGQGNSLIKGEIKALQTQAVVCSLLRNFATVVVGVTRLEDQKYLAETLSHLDNKTTSQRVKVQLLETFKPANLPFALLEWGRTYIKGVNECVRKNVPDYKKKSSNDRSDIAAGSICNFLFPVYSGYIIQYIYYTESDQILHFSDPFTRAAIMSATNSSTFLIGRRMEKQVIARNKDKVKSIQNSFEYMPVSSAAYMTDLMPTRALCGDPNDVYYMDWPASNFIRKY